MRGSRPETAVHHRILSNKSAVRPNSFASQTYANNRPSRLAGLIGKGGDMFSKQLILLISVISLVGCTSMRTVDVAEPDFADQFETGDHLVVYEKQGRIVDMKVTRIEDDVLYGSLSDNGLRTVEVSLEDIEKIEIEKISGAKTTGAVLGGIVLLPVVAVGAVLAVAESAQ